jgi:hypothetical protein
VNSAASSVIATLLMPTRRTRTAKCGGATLPIWSSCWEGGQENRESPFVEIGRQSVSGQGSDNPSARHTSWAGAYQHRGRGWRPAASTLREARGALSALELFGSPVPTNVHIPADLGTHRRKENRAAAVTGAS